MIPTIAAIQKLYNLLKQSNGVHISYITPLFITLTHTDTKTHTHKHTPTRAHTHTHTHTHKHTHTCTIHEQDHFLEIRRTAATGLCAPGLNVWQKNRSAKRLLTVTTNLILVNHCLICQIC